METNLGCCGHPSICSVEDGRCKAREDWLRAQNRDERGTWFENHAPAPKETRAERKARIKAQCLKRQEWERKQPSYDLGRTR